MWNYIGNIGAGWLVHNFRQPPVEGKAVNGTSRNFLFLDNLKFLNLISNDQYEQMSQFYNVLIVKMR